MSETISVEAALPSPPVPPSRGWVLIAVMAMMFMIAIKGTIVATAMPTIVGALGGFDLFSWVFTAYLLSQAVTVPIYGRLADLYGRKRILFFGMAVFLAASILCGLAWNMVALVVFRLFQGIGAGALLPVGMTIVADLYNPAERARIQAVVSSVWVIGAIVAPILGAFLIAHASWPTVFWVNVPLGIIAAALLAWALRERRGRLPHRIDYIGSVLMIVGSGVLMFVLVQASKLGLATILALASVSFVTLAALVVYERRINDPMLPLALWRDPIVIGSNVANVCLGGVLMGITAFVPPYVQGVMGKSALVAGVMLTAMSAAWPTGSAVAGRAMLLTSYRATAIAGSLSLIVGSAMLIAVTPEHGALFIAAAAALSGLGMGLANNSFLIAVQATVAASDRGVATSSVVFMRMVGQSLGTAIYGGIVNAGLSDRIAGGGDIVDRMLLPAFRATIPYAELAPLMHELAGALHNVFIVDGGLAFILIACCAFLPAGLSPIRPARR